MENSHYKRHILTKRHNRHTHQNEKRRLYVANFNEEKTTKSSSTEEGPPTHRECSVLLEKLGSLVAYICGVCNSTFDTEARVLKLRRQMQHFYYKFVCHCRNRPFETRN